MGDEILLAVHFKNNKNKLGSFRCNFKVLKNQYPGFTLDTDWVVSLMEGSIEWPEFRRRIVESTHPQEHCSAYILGPKSKEGELKDGEKNAVGKVLSEEDIN